MSARAKPRTPRDGAAHPDFVLIDALGRFHAAMRAVDEAIEAARTDSIVMSARQRAALRKAETEDEARYSELLNLLCKTPARTVTGAAIKLWLAIEFIAQNVDDTADATMRALVTAWPAIEPLAGIAFPPFSRAARLQLAAA